MNDYLRPIYLQSIWETLFMALITLVIGGICGLVLGILLYATRRGGLLANKIVHTILNVIVNIIRPIPFIIFMTAIALTLKVIGTTIGVRAATFLCASQRPSPSPGLLSRILSPSILGLLRRPARWGPGRGGSFDVVAREALGPLILGYTYILIAIVDMTAIAGALGGGGLGQFAITYGYQRYNWAVTAVAVVTIIIVVQLAQFLGNWLARRALRR